jgi:thiamine-phosphate pyrophosphorylase
VLESSFTAGAQRALDRAQARARQRGATIVETVDLLAALSDESESRAAELMSEFGLAQDRVWHALGVGELALSESELAAFTEERLPQSSELRTALSDAALHARALDRERSVGTEHLLAGLLSTPSPALGLLEAAGLALSALRTSLNDGGLESAPIPVPSEIPPLELGGSAQTVELSRILDASANRAREGLRVVEDYTRFVLDDPGLTRRLKEVRHRLGEALSGLEPELLVGSRDTRGDVGTHIMTASERVRENPRAVLSANFKRTAEALRSLEEYAKLVDVWLAGRFEVLRYDVYTLEKLTLTAASSNRLLGDARLMLLVGGLPTMGDLTWIVGEALAGGADIIQLREKGLPDREWLRRAREVRILTAQAKARFVVNDRPDLARLAGADGVHLGQDDLIVRDARRVVGPSMLIGVSTHDRVQIEQAVLSGAGYLGIGPVFASATKEFTDLAGLALLLHAAEATNLPWFAIGGISGETIDDALDAGARRIAVSAAIVRAEYPRRAAAELRAKLDAVWEDGQSSP